MKQSARLSAGTRTQMDRADRRFETLRRLSAEGATFMQAMDAVGMSYDGARGLLYRRTGSTVWPIKERV